MHFRPMIAALAAVALVPLSACSGEGGDSAEQQAGQSLAEAIGAGENHARLAEALEETGLAGIFEGAGDYTVLAPANGAFEGLGEDAETAVVAAVLREHILPGAITPDDIKASLEGAGGEGVAMATMGSDAVTFTLEDGRVVATSGEGRKVVLSDTPVRAANGVLIPVDALLKDAAGPEA